MRAKRNEAVWITPSVRWINQGTTEPPGNGITIAIPPIYEVYWTLDPRGSADHEQDEQLAPRVDVVVIELLDAHTPAQS